MTESTHDHVRTLLNLLLTQEAGSLLHAVQSFGIYLQPSQADVHQILANMAQDIRDHVSGLAHLLESLNIPITATAINPNAGSLAYLSLKFFLPRLIAEKNRFIAIYQVALAQLPADADAQITSLLNAHLEHHKQHLAAFQRAAST